MARRSDWNFLSCELLSRIFITHLTFHLDYLRFRSVCSSWRSSAPKRPHLPWLISHQQNTTLFTFSTLSLSPTDNNNINITSIPHFPQPSFFFYRRLPCIGSSSGWMAFLDPESRCIILYNPIITSQIHLPSLPQSLDFNHLDLEIIPDQ